MKHTLPTLALIALSASTSLAAGVRVIVTGSIESNAFPANGINTFGGILAGAPVTLTLELDSTQFLDSPNLPGRTRGYVIQPGTMRLTAGTASAARLETTPAYFVLRNNDPRVDGFFLSQGTDIDTSIPLQMVPAGFGVQFSRTFDINTPAPTPDDSLTSLNILDALGSWQFNDISSYNFAVGIGEFNLPMILAYESITIETLCPADLDDGSGTGASDGAITVDDLLYFLGAFEAGTAAADLDNGSGTGNPDGGVTIDDLLFFLVRFEAGC